MIRYAQSRKDGNHTYIKGLCERLAGKHNVLDTHGNGDDCPDLFVGFRGITHPCEIKTEEGKLSPGQQALIDNWNGSPIQVLQTQNDVLRMLGFVK